MRIGRILKVAVALVVLVVTLATVGCNTVRGAGKDIETLGKHIEKSADK